MIVISNSLVLAPTGDNPLNTPVFGWNNLATEANVGATSQQDGFPVQNVANPSTALAWRCGAPLGVKFLTATVNQVDPIDFLAVAGHNFGSAKIAVSVWGYTELTGSPPEADWFELVSLQMVVNDDPLLIRWSPQPLFGVTLRMEEGLDLPRVAVLYVGKLLVLERGTHSDHVPINFGRTSTVLPARSESGHYLGQVVISEGRETAFALKYLRDSWYRTQMDPFIAASKEVPFFFAWKPQEYPGDVGYCSMTNQPQPTRDFVTGRMGIDLQMTGVAFS